MNNIKLGCAHFSQLLMYPALWQNFFPVFVHGFLPSRTHYRDFFGGFFFSSFPFSASFLDSG